MPYGAAIDYTTHHNEPSWPATVEPTLTMANAKNDSDPSSILKDFEKLNPELSFGSLHQPHHE